MKGFFLDLWEDLRSKRLWPVAVALLAGLIAAPLVLSKDSEAPPASPAVAAAAKDDTPEPPGPQGFASIDVEEAGATAGSALDTFDPSDPFKPPAKILARAREEAADTSGAGPSSESTSEALSEEDGASSGGSSSSGAGAPSGDTGAEPDDGGGEAGGGDDGPPAATTEYTYVIDVTFSVNARTRKIRGMERLDMLPGQASPLLIFLGVSANAGNAVFLVDSTLDAAGEGSCKPSRAECAFLHLGAGSEHAFTNDEGDSYDLRVDQIRKVKVSATAKAHGARVGAEAAGSAARRFVPPLLLADLVSVSSRTLRD